MEKIGKISDVDDFIAHTAELLHMVMFREIEIPTDKEFDSLTADMRAQYKGILNNK